jgi:PadR family transcriptional regulator PadR
MGNKADVWQGTLALMILRTLDSLGPQHGYGIARRIEQTSGRQVLLNQGTVYAALVRLQRDGLIAAAWGSSDNNRRAKFYTLTKAGTKHLAAETRQWRRLSDVMNRVLSAPPERAR